MLTLASTQPNALRQTSRTEERSEARPQASAAAKPHICFVAPEVWPVFSGDTSIEVVGGAEVQQSILARLLARAGYRVSIICFDYGQPRRVEIDGVTLIATHRLSAGIPVLRFIHPRITAMWQAMRELDADIYYQRSTAALTAVVAAFCRRYGKRSIYAGASDSDFVPGQQMIQYRRDAWLFERGLARVDRVVVQNEKQQRDCLANYGRDSTLIPSCYELPTTAGAPRTQGSESDSDREQYVLWVGTLRPTKRPELFLELARRLPNRHFVLIGGASETDPGGAERFAEIRKAASSIANVELTGFLPLAQVEPWFDGAQVVVNTSFFEGMPNVFLQAWARGVPTLAFTDTGSRLDGKPVYPVVSDADEAAAEIERLFTDDLHRARAAARCREYFNQTHGSTGVLARYAALIDELAGSRR
jgi:glycosyltransferase involved in cell wall biosynthesis